MEVGGGWATIRRVAHPVASHLVYRRRPPMAFMNDQGQSN